MLEVLASQRQWSGPSLMGVVEPLAGHRDWLGPLLVVRSIG